MRPCFEKQQASRVERASRITLALWATVLATVLAVTPAAPAAKPAIWFIPQPPPLRRRQGQWEFRGAALRRYLALFGPHDSWGYAAAATRVFGVFPQWIQFAPAADLKRQFMFLRQHHIALALKVEVLSAPGRDGKVEGFAWPDIHQNLRRIARRLQQVGGQEPRYLFVDEPLFFGSIYSGPLATKWTPDQVAADAAPAFRTLLQTLPSARIVDTEPVGGSPRGIRLELRRYQRGLAVLRHTLGPRLSAFRADVGWHTLPPGALAAFERLAHAQHLNFLVIADGNGDETSNMAWIDDAERHWATVTAAIGRSEGVVFQSWNPYPLKLLPETAPDAFTHLIYGYLYAQTTLTASLSGQIISGRLTTLTGRPIAGAAIRVQFQTLGGRGKMAVLTTHGTIAPDAKRLAFVITANDRNILSGPINITVRQFRLVTRSGWSAVCRFRKPSDLRCWRGLPQTPHIVAAVHHHGLYLHAPRGRPWQLVSPFTAIPARARGQPYTFSVQARIAPASLDAGYFTALLRQVSGSRLIFFHPTGSVLGVTTTAADGSWAIRWSGRMARHFRVLARYPGGKKYWPAEAHVTRRVGAWRRPGTHRVR